MKKLRLLGLDWNRSEFGQSQMFRRDEDRDSPWQKKPTMREGGKF